MTTRTFNPHHLPSARSAHLDGADSYLDATATDSAIRRAIVDSKRRAIRQARRAKRIAQWAWMAQ